MIYVFQDGRPETANYHRRTFECWFCGCKFISDVYRTYEEVKGIMVRRECECPWCGLDVAIYEQKPAEVNNEEEKDNA